MKFKKIVQYTLVLMLAVGFTACSDNGSDSGEDNQPPNIPALAENTQPDISFFQNNNPSSTSLKGEVNLTVQNFNTAKVKVLGTAVFFSIAQLYVEFFNNASQEDAEFTDGRWVWEYSVSQGGQSAGIRLTAQPQGNGFEWALFFSGNDGQGNVFENFKFVEGPISSDGAQGDLTFFAPGEGEDPNNPVPLIISNWNRVSESEHTLNAEIFEGTEVSSTFSYQQNGSEYVFNIDFVDEEDPLEAFWNTETFIGYCIQGAERLCWDGSFQDTACSEIGL